MATEYYKQMLKEGTAYQERISKLLGFRNYSTMQEQFRVGENALGMEIKYDKNIARKGNLYFEVMEKSNANNPDYIPSGILRNDNSWLYMVGNDEVAYVFTKRDMFSIIDGERLVEAGTKTSLGYLIPIEKAEKWKVFKKNLTYGDIMFDNKEVTQKIKSRVSQWMQARGMI